MIPDPARVVRLFSRKADLNPPLGYPGGSCQVIERILSDARTKKEDLIQKVEQAEDLTNAEASIVYQPIVEDKSRTKGTMFDFIALTPHAQYRMDLRQITVADLVRAFRNFQEVYAKDKAQQSPRYKDLERAIQRTEEIRWEFDGMRIVFQIATFAGGKRAAKVISAIRLDHKALPVQRSDCKPFEGWADLHVDPRSNFDRLFRTAMRRNAAVLVALDGSHFLVAKSETGPGVQTYVRTDEPSTDEKRYTGLPPGSATPGGEGRDVGKFESNTPDNDIDKRPRSLPEQGEDYGHPVNNDGTSPDHRSIYAWQRHWSPGHRQHRQHGQAKRKSHAYYLQNRSKILAKQRIRRARNRHNPAAIASERKRRKQNRHRISSEGTPCFLCVAERFAANFRPPRERGGEDGGPQRRQPRPEAREDARDHRQNRYQDNRDARRYYKMVCKKHQKCMDRREEYREDPDYYKRRAPKQGSAMLAQDDIAFLIGPQKMLGYVDSVSGLSGMVNIRLDAQNASQLMAMPVEVFLRAATLLTEEDNEDFFELVEQEIGLEAYDDLDEEGLRECARWFGVDPDSPLFEAACLELTGAPSVEDMTPQEIEEVTDHVVLAEEVAGG